MPTAGTEILLTNMTTAD